MSTIKIGKTTIDVEKIATGLLEMTGDMGESYQCALRFGMLPAPLMDILKREISRKAEEIGEDEHWEQEVMHKIVCKMLGQADLFV